MTKKPDWVRKPDYYLALLNKRTDERVHNVGAAWKNNDGSINIQLVRFVVLPSDPEWVINLFPRIKENSQT